MGQGSVGEGVVWTPDMELGNATIDSQHRGLVELVGLLQAALGREDRRAQVELLFGQLEQYVLIHFSFEEEWMMGKKVQHLEAHLKEHRQFERTVALFKQRFETGDRVGEEMSKYLVHWLRHHILTVDREYAEQLQLQSESGTEPKTSLDV
ncbi:MAG: bacteriohemerythrin [bacterium]|nr:bacteriohemerythrin [bacterium]